MGGATAHGGGAATHRGGAASHRGGATTRWGGATALTTWLPVMELFETDQIRACAPTQRETLTFLFEETAVLYFGAEKEQHKVQKWWVEEVNFPTVPSLVLLG